MDKINHAGWLDLGLRVLGIKVFCAGHFYTLTGPFFAKPYQSVLTWSPFCIGGKKKENSLADNPVWEERIDSFLLQKLT